MTTARFLLRWCLPMAFFLAAAGARGQDRVITAGELEAAGVARLSEIASLLDNWASFSVEGYSRDFSVGGLTPLGASAWALFVDGVPVDLRVLGMQDINSLPIALTEIDRVELYEQPTIIAGRFVPAGALDIRMRTPDERLAVRAHVFGGNESGDPGPFRYTALASPNIDRIGPTFQGSLSSAGSRWFVRVQGKADEHHATDERIRERVLTLYRGIKAPRLILGTMRAEAGRHSPRGWSTAFGSASCLSGLWFFDPLGLELPAVHEFLQAGMTGGRMLSSALGLRWAATVTRSDFRVRSNPAGHDGWTDDRRFRGHVVVSAPQAEAGISTDVVYTSFKGESERTSLTQLRAYVNAHHRTDSAVKVSGSLVVDWVDVELSYAAIAGIEAALRPELTITATGTASRRHPAQEQNFWYRVRKGYVPPSSVGIAPLGESAAAHMLTADLKASLRLSETVRFLLAGGWRDFRGGTLVRMSPRYDEATTGFITPTSLHAGVPGRTARLGVTVEGTLRERLAARLYYGFLRSYSPREVFHEGWLNQPARRASATVRYAAAGRLTLFARIHSVGRSHWAVYDNAADASGGLYVSRIPSAHLLDVTVTKSLWEHRMVATVSLRNVLNRAHRAHPAGAVTYMALHLGVRILLRRPARGREETE